MRKLTMTSLAAISVLLGTSFAVSASNDDDYKRGLRQGYSHESREHCRKGENNCAYRYRYRRNHEWSERYYRARDERNRRSRYHND